METIINVSQNLTQNLPMKIVGEVVSEHAPIFQFNLTVFLVTVLVSLISAPFLLIVIALVMYTSDKILEDEKHEVNKSVIKSVPLTSFFWIFLQNRTNIPRSIEAITKRFGLAFKVNIFGLIRNVVINDHVILKKLDIFTDPIHLHKPSWYHKIMPHLIKNRTTTTPAQREALLQAFNNKNLPNHMKIFEKHAKAIVSTFQEEMKSNTENGINPNKNFDQLISKCAYDIFADMSFGEEVKITTQEKIQLVKYFERVKFLAEFCFNHHFTLPNFLWALYPVKWYMDRTFRPIFQIVNKITENYCKTVTADSKSDKVIDMTGKSLIEAMSRAGLSSEEISAEAIAFMAWGHGTVSTTLSKLIFNLAEKREYQNKCHQEIVTMFKHMENGEITKEALDSLEYMERCIQESMRLYPTFPLFGRKVNTTVQLDENITIKSGTKILTCHWLLHRNSVNFPKPTEFTPDRFLPEKSHNNEVYDYMSCSLGPQNCIWHQLITQQLKVLTSYILHDFEISTDMQKADTMQKLTPFVALPSSRTIKIQRRK